MSTTENEVKDLVAGKAEDRNNDVPCNKTQDQVRKLIAF